MPLDKTLADRLPFLSAAISRSESILEAVRAEGTTLPPNVAIIANGSLARSEITSLSDFDAYVLAAERGREAEEAAEALTRMQGRSGLRTAAADGAFGHLQLGGELIENIGGQHDDNDRFTRRMLFVLESVPLAGVDYYRSCVDALVRRYINDDTAMYQIGRFLLNDVIRYYRTICVDFEHKTYELGKSWGIRNIKLVYSRKLMYFSGVAMCAELAHRSPNAKRKTLLDLIALTPVQRILSIFGQEIVPALEHYEFFLSQIDQPDVRKALEAVDLDRATHTAAYRDLKDGGHQFSWKLISALHRAYPPSHPIHDALVL